MKRKTFAKGLCLFVSLMISFGILSSVHIVPVLATTEIYSVKVNCGGGAVDGLSADQAYTSGSWGYQNVTGTSGTYSVNDTISPDCTYPNGLKSQRYDNQGYANNEFKYKFDCPNGTYTVRLYFAELYFTDSNSRDFDVKINGTVVLPNFNVYDEAGGHDKGVMEIYTSQTVTGGTLEISFVTKATGQSCMINAISVDNYYCVRVNCGGAAADGLSADQAYTSGSWGYQNVTGTSGTYSVNDTISPNCNLPNAAKSQRYDNQGYINNEFKYKFDCPNGNYTVKLYFAETYFTSANNRNFDVKINGTTVLSNYNVFIDAGGHDICVEKVFTGQWVTGGTLEISFITKGTYNSCIINAISVENDWVYEGGGLLLPNGNMETSYANWKPTEWEIAAGVGYDDNAYKSTAQKHSGMYSLSLDDTGTSTAISIRSPYLKATPQTSYTVKGWLYPLSGAGSITLEFWDSSKASLGTQTYTSSGTGSWREGTATMTAPANTAAVTVLLSTSTANTGTCYYDDITIEGMASFQYSYGDDITSEKQYFYDDNIIESMINVDRITNQGTKYGSVIIQPEYAWEGYGSNYPLVMIVSVIYDSQESIYKMWYNTYCESTNLYYTCYAYSSDAINWIKPLNLGVYTFNGNTNNNITRSHIMGQGTEIKDVAESDPNKRYKMFGWKGPWGDANDGYFIYYSSDGFTWTTPYNTPRFYGSECYHDVASMAYDALHSKYLGSIKYWGGNGREFRMTTSTNFTDWSAPKRHFTTDAEDQTIYTATDVYVIGIYPTDGGYFGLPSIFYHMNDGSDDGPVDVQLACGRDEYNWVRPSRQAVIPLGAPGTWEDGQIYAASYPIEIGDEIRWYYSGGDHTHAQAGSILASYATWRKDGFVSLNAGSIEGTVITKPVKFTGNNTLLLNVDASGGGSVQVEILDSSNNVLSGFAKSDCDVITSDNLNCTVTWDGSSDISSLAGQNIKFKIYMTNAKLYSLKTTTPISKEAESYDNMSGIVNQTTYIGYCDNGDWVCYNNVNLGNGYSQLIAKVAVDNGLAGQKAVVRLDSTTGEVIGTLTVAGTGGWDIFQEQSISLNGKAIGTHNVYICFVGSSGVGNFDWFKFK